MSELFPVDPLAERLAEQVLEAGQAIRVREHALRQQLAEQAEMAREREGSPEAQLAGEVNGLTERMTWLYEHPKLRRFIGHSAIGTICDDDRRCPDTILTPALTDGDIALLHGEHLLFSGLVFRTDYRSKTERRMLENFAGKVAFRRKLHIDQQVKDESTGATGTRRLYEMYPYTSKVGPKVHVQGRGFNDYRSQKCEEAIEKYTKDNPWAQKLISEYGSKEYSYFNHPSMLMSVRLPGRYDYKKHEYIYRLNRELVPHFKPGNGWEYPQDLFLEPLALVKEMNMLLGTKKQVNSGKIGSI